MTHPHEEMRSGARWLPVVFWLYLVAAALAFAAVAIGYMNDRKIEATPLGGGLFMLVMAFVTRARISKNRDGGA